MSNTHFILFYLPKGRGKNFRFCRFTKNFLVKFTVFVKISSFLHFRCYTGGTARNCDFLRTMVQKTQMVLEKAEIFRKCFLIYIMETLCERRNSPYELFEKISVNLALGTLLQNGFVKVSENFATCVLKLKCIFGSKLI
jgi:hypothetical protein